MEIWLPQPEFFDGIFMWLQDMPYLDIKMTEFLLTIQPLYRYIINAASGPSQLIMV